MKTLLLLIFVLSSICSFAQSEKSDSASSKKVTPPKVSNAIDTIMLELTTLQEAKLAAADNAKVVAEEKIKELIEMFVDANKIDSKKVLKVNYQKPHPNKPAILIVVRRK